MIGQTNGQTEITTLYIDITLRNGKCARIFELTGITEILT